MDKYIKDHTVYHELKYGWSEFRLLALKGNWIPNPNPNTIYSSGNFYYSDHVPITFKQFV